MFKGNMSLFLVSVCLFNEYFRLSLGQEDQFKRYIWLLIGPVDQFNGYIRHLLYVENYILFI